MKKKAYWISAIIVIILIIAGVFAFNKHQQQENDVQSIRKKVTSKNISTFFFHGWGSSYHAEEDMTAAIKNIGVSNTIVRVNVNKKRSSKDNWKNC